MFGDGWRDFNGVLGVVFIKEVVRKRRIKKSVDVYVLLDQRVCAFVVLPSGESLVNAWVICFQ